MRALTDDARVAGTASRSRAGGCAGCPAVPTHHDAGQVSRASTLLPRLAGIGLGERTVFDRDADRYQLFLIAESGPRRAIGIVGAARVRSTAAVVPAHSCRPFADAGEASLTIGYTETGRALPGKTRLLTASAGAVAQLTAQGRVLQVAGARAETSHPRGRSPQAPLTTPARGNVPAARRVIGHALPGPTQGIELFRRQGTASAFPDDVDVDVAPTSTPDGRPTRCAIGRRTRAGCRTTHQPEEREGNAEPAEPTKASTGRTPAVK